MSYRNDPSIRVRHNPTGFRAEYNASRMCNLETYFFRLFALGLLEIIPKASSTTEILHGANTVKQAQEQARLVSVRSDVTRTHSQQQKLELDIPIWIHGLGKKRTKTASKCPLASLWTGD